MKTNKIAAILALTIGSSTLNLAYGSEAAFLKEPTYSFQNVQTGIKGRVFDASTNSPISGATVRIKDTNHVVQTDGQGRFEFSDMEQNIVVVSMVGYDVAEQAISSDEIIYLNPTNELIDEVVVTALGIKREQKALGYSVQEVKGDQLQKVKGVDVGTTLTGRVSGLRVMNSTEFNATPSMDLRGKTPILVIDGVLYKNLNLRDIPVDNIENISVLKGATASALYGVDGSAGALMITTKKGLSDKGTVVSQIVCKDYLDLIRS